MGGMGSSRWGGYTKRTTVEECRWLDVRRLRREGIIARGRTCRTGWYWRDDSGNTRASVDLAASGEAVELAYTLTTGEAPETIRYTVPVVWTEAPRGAWFLCPEVKCGRRVAKLYLPPGGRYFLCRHCHGLSYASRQQWDKRIAFFRRHPDLAAAIMRNPGARVSVRLAAIRAGLWREV